MSIVLATCTAAGVVVYYLYRLQLENARLREAAARPTSASLAAADATKAAAWQVPVTLTRELPLVLGESAIVVIDMQNFCCHPNGGAWVSERPPAYYMEQLPHVLGNIRALLAAARRARVECIFTTIESLTLDGRDRSLDYKVSGFNVPRGSWDARVLDEIHPLADEIVLPKCSSSVFISTNLAYKLRNLNVKQVVLVGGLTDQCVDSAVRDACDLGFLVTCVTDACITKSRERHITALANNKGYARQRTTLELLPELAGPEAPTSVQPCALLWSMAAGGTSVAACGAPVASPSPTEGAGSMGSVGARAYIRYEVTDLNGKALSKTVPARHRGETVYLYSGAIALGANAEVLTIPKEVMEAGCPNTALVPDWQSEQLLPWASNVAVPAPGVILSRVICEQLSVIGDGTALNGAIPRTTCKRLLDELRREHGLRLLAAAEYEFCLADAEEWSKPMTAGPEIFTTLQMTKVGSFCYVVEEAMASVGIDVRTMNTEYGAGQVEITFEPKWGVGAADAACTFRTAVKEIAQQQGMLATFMSKAFSTTGPGNGGHLNFSLWKAGNASQTVGEDGAASAELPCESGEAGEGELLPTGLGEALDALEGDGHMVRALGTELISWFLLLKRAELEAVEKRIEENMQDRKLPHEQAKIEAWNHYFMEFL